MIRSIVIAPHQALKTKAKPVEKVTDQIKALANDMLETMYKNDGAGLAANQINLLAQIVVLDCSKDLNEPLVLINPDIFWKSNKTDSLKEGCLSFPGVFLPITRSTSIKTRYLDENGDLCEKQFDGIWARCIQHEVDHINGITFIDHLPPIQRRRMLAKAQPK